MIDPKNYGCRDQAELSRHLKNSYDSKIILTPDMVRDIRQLAAEGVKHKDVAKIHGVSKVTVQRIVNRKTYSWV